MYITRKAKKYNEDGILYKPPIYMVIDGATPLEGDQKAAYLLKTYIIRQFIPLYKKHKNIKTTLQQLSSKYYQLKAFKDEKPVELPSAGLAIVIDHDTHFELFLLGDTSITVLFKSGDIKTYHDNRLSIMDEKAYAIQDKVEQLKQIKHNRNQLGILYDAFLPSNQLEFEAKSIHIDKALVQTIRLYSDGFSSILDTYHDMDISTFMKKDIKSIIKRIEDLSFCEGSMSKYQRFKVIDDISVIEISN